MSLENVKLPGLVIANLYKHSLVTGEERTEVQNVTAEAAPAATSAPAKAIIEVEPAPAPAAETKLRFLGKNQRFISILVNFPGEPFLPESHLELLTKMLNACKLNLGDVAIINIATATVEIEKLKEQLTPKYVLLFGVDSTSIQLPFQFPFFKEQQYAGCTYLSVPALQELNKDNDEGKTVKRKLWECLKKMFNI